MAIEILSQGRKADIYIYKNNRNEPLALDYIKKLNIAEQSKLVRLLEAFAELGEIKNIQKFRAEEKPFYAFKSYQNRILCFYLPDTPKKTVVLTHGFTKKQDRMPKSEILKAKKIYKEIMELL